MSIMMPSLRRDFFVVVNVAMNPTIPSTIVIWLSSLPMIFPTAIPEASFPAAVLNPAARLVDISGREVPIEVIVNPIMSSDIPIHRAIVLAASTTTSLPIQRPNRPTTINAISSNILFFFNYFIRNNIFSLFLAVLLCFFQGVPLVSASSPPCF